MTVRGLEQFIMLREPACRHSWRTPDSEGWFDATYCAQTPLRGEAYCLAHRPPDRQKEPDGWLRGPSLAICRP